MWLRRLMSSVTALAILVSGVSLPTAQPAGASLAKSTERQPDDGFVETTAQDAAEDAAGESFKDGVDDVDATASGHRACLVNAAAVLRSVARCAARPNAPTGPVQVRGPPA